MSSSVRPPVAIGIDCGATHLRAAAVDASGRIHRRVRRTVPSVPAERAAAPLEAAADLAAGAVSVGLAVAGTVADGTLIWSAHLGLADVPFAQRLAGHTGLPAIVVNDARAAGYAEAVLGTARGRGVTLYVSVGSGIGGAIIIDRRLVDGAGDAGEIGHLSIDPAGPPCSCGRRGCWEQLAGGRALDRAASSLMSPVLDPDSAQPTARDLVQAAESGNQSAQQAITRAAASFASGLDSVCAVLSPNRVVLGGGIIGRGGPLAARYLAATNGLRWLRTPPVVASLGDDAGVIGAALLSLREAPAGAAQEHGPTETPN